MTVKRDQVKSFGKSVEAAEIHIHLSPIKHTYERSAFTLMMVLGELGGIYGAIVSIPSFFISHFIQNLFRSAVTDVMPVKPRINIYSNNSVQSKLKTNGDPVVLGAEEVQDLALEAQQIGPRPK